MKNLHILVENLHILVENLHILVEKFTQVDNMHSFKLEDKTHLL